MSVVFPAIVPDDWGKEIRSSCRESSGMMMVREGWGSGRSDR